MRTHTDVQFESSSRPLPELNAPYVGRRAIVDGDQSGDDSAGLPADKFLHALRRRWWIAVPLAVAVTAGIGWVVSTKVPPVYTARSLLHVPSNRPAVLYGELDGRSDSVNFQRTQIATVKSRLVLESAVRDLQPRNLELVRNQGDPVAWLESQVTADYTVAPEILQLKMKESNPDEMCIVLNCLRDAYVREILNKDHNDRVTHLKQLTDLASVSESRLSAQREVLLSRAEGLGARDLQSLRMMYEQETIRIQALKSEQSYLRSFLKRMELTEGDKPPEMPLPPVALAELVEVLVASDETIAVHRKEIVALEASLLEYRQRLRNYEEDSNYKLKAAELAATRELISARRREHEVAAEQKLQATERRRKDQELTNQQQMFTAMRQYVPQLETEIAKREKSAAELAKGLGELDLLQKGIAQEEERAKLIDSRIRAMEIELQAPPRARVLEEAVIAETPQMQRYAKMAVLPLVSGASVLLLIGWLDLRGGRINQSLDLESQRLKVLAVVPAVRKRALTTFRTPESLGRRTDLRRLADAVDMAREMIVPVLPVTGGYVLTVTSAGAGEGKTAVAGHLAVRLARTGRRTLVIDADTRNPRLHALFGLPSKPGFRELLRGEAELADVTQEGPVPDLHVITVGGTNPDALSGSLAAQIPTLLTTLRSQYDVIILDTAPVLVAPETLVLGRYSDGVLLSVMRDVSRIREVVASSDRLAAVNASVLGVIFNGDRATRHSKY